MKTNIIFLMFIINSCTLNSVLNIEKKIYTNFNSFKLRPYNIPEKINKNKLKLECIYNKTNILSIVKFINDSNKLLFEDTIYYKNNTQYFVHLNNSKTYCTFKQNNSLITIIFNEFNKENFISKIYKIDSSGEFCSMEFEKITKFLTFDSFFKSNSFEKMKFQEFNKTGEYQVIEYKYSDKKIKFTKVFYFNNLKSRYEEAPPPPSALDKHNFISYANCIYVDINMFYFFNNYY